MHVAIISADCAPNPGGVAAHVLHLAVALDRLGVRVTVLGGCRSPEQLAAFSPPFPDFQVRAIGHIRRVSVGLFALWARKQFLRLTGRTRVDVAHLHTLVPEGFLLLGRSREMARVATNHTAEFLVAHARGRSRRHYRFALRNCDGVIAPSRELEEKSPYLGVPRRRIHYVPNGVDETRFSPGEPAPKVRAWIAPFTRDHRIVLATRRLDPKNGLHLLLDAIPSVREACPDARFLFAGDGPERDRLRAQSRALGVEGVVKFLGNVSREKLPDLYRLSDVCVLPSLQEATSISGLEAMACGKPLVGSAVGGIPEIIDDGVTGVLVSPGDPQSLAGGLAGLLGSAARRKGMGKKARERVLDRFTWSTIARRTVEVYEACLRRKG